MKLSEFQNMTIDDFKSLATDARREIISSISAMANRNLNALKKAGILSPSMQARYKDGIINYFSAKDKNANELMHEFKNLKSFMDNETRTVKGAKKWYSKLEERLTNGNNVKIEKGDISEFFKLYTKAKENPEIASRMTFKYNEHNPQYMATVSGRDAVSPLFKAYKELKQNYSDYYLEEKFMDYIDKYTKDQYDRNLGLIEEDLDSFSVIDDFSEDFDDDDYDWDLGDIYPDENPFR